MKLESIKQIMNNKARLDALANEVILHARNIRVGKFKLSDARKMAQDQVKRNESDPHLFAHIVSGLMNGSLTPEDFSGSHS